MARIERRLTMIYKYIGGPCDEDIQDIQGMDHGGDYIIPCVQMVRLPEIISKLSADLPDVHPHFTNHLYKLDPETRQAQYVSREEKP